MCVVDPLPRRAQRLRSNCTPATRVIQSKPIPFQADAISQTSFMNSQRYRLLTRTMVLIVAVLLSRGGLSAYSVLTHEEIIDLAWTAGIRPLLLLHFPGMSEDEIKDAHAYAYGGSVIQDLGYYPFGSRQFSELVHYVRTGDFVLELLRQSENANEYAFALGALSHYTADLYGHPAINEAVAIRYPKLRARYGMSVRYAQDTTAHLKTEFGFDTLQVARNRYRFDQYHKFIGFKVSLPLLERTFPVIYGLQLKHVLVNEDMSIGSYRFSVSKLIPQMTKVALETHKKDLMRETPDFAEKKFLYRLSRADYEQEWGKTYMRVGFGTRFLAALLRFIPKIGPLKGMGFNNPTPRTEDLYIRSINSTVDHYRAFLDEARAGTLILPNYDLDDGNLTTAAEYSLADETYAALLLDLAAGNFEETSPQLKSNILAFYTNRTLPIWTKKTPARWQTVLADLTELRAATPIPEQR